MFTNAKAAEAGMSLMSTMISNAAMSGLKSSSNHRAKDEKKHQVASIIQDTMSELKSSNDHRVKNGKKHKVVSIKQDETNHDGNKVKEHFVDKIISKIIAESNDRADYWDYLSMSPNAVKYFRSNLDKIDWHRVACNNHPEVINILRENIDKVQWPSICKNSDGIDLLCENIDKVNLDEMFWTCASTTKKSLAFMEKHFDTIMKSLVCDELFDERDIFTDNICSNLNTDEFLKKHPELINLNTFIHQSQPLSKYRLQLLHDNIDMIPDHMLYYLSKNPYAIDVVRANQNKINWTGLSSNPAAIDLLEANQDKIDWKELSKNPNAIRLLEANQDKIDWKELSKNPNAIRLLEANKDKVHWGLILANTRATHLIQENIYDIDFEYAYYHPLMKLIGLEDHASLVCQSYLFRPLPFEKFVEVHWKKIDKRELIQYIDKMYPNGYENMNMTSRL